MRLASHRVRAYSFLILIILLGYNSCSLSGLKLRLRPVRKLINKERMYWTDKVEYRGDAGTELVYYKNGRPALERNFNKLGLLESVRYLGRNGAAIRYDSLVYADDELIAGYYFSEPGHQLILRFLSYKQQGQLSQRSWFGGFGELLSREFFLFDRNGQRRMRMIFDKHDVLLYSETFRKGSDQLEIQNAYTGMGLLANQIRHTENQQPYRYDFDQSGLITRISQLHADGTPAWSSDLFYDPSGALEQASFTTNDRFLFTYLGDLEFYKKSLRSWQHPMQPNIKTQSFKIGHQDPFVAERTELTDGKQLIEYRLPGSGALFKSSIISESGQALSDTLYASRSGIQPISVIAYDTLGLVSEEITYNLAGNPSWRHTWFRDNDRRVIREELSELPDSFTAAVTRFYDGLGQPAFSERFSRPDAFDGTWVFYNGGGINKTLFYNDQSELTGSWLFAATEDTLEPASYESIDFFKIESKYGPGDTLTSQRRYTNDGILSWELFFNGEGQLYQEIHRKNDGSIYKEVNYEPESKLIKANVYGPIDVYQVNPGAELRGELASRIITRLNSQGETVQIISKNSNDQTEWEKRYAYRDGRLVKSAQLGADGKPVVIASYTHNELGQILTERGVDKFDSLAHSVDYSYDENNQLIWKTFSSNWMGTSSSNRYYYDDQDRLQRTEVIEAQRFIEAIEYAYFPEYYLRVATHLNPAGEILRKEIENYFAGSVFDIGATKGE